jgi:hypothetical protein
MFKICPFQILPILILSTLACKYYAKSNTYNQFVGTAKILSGYIG